MFAGTLTENTNDKTFAGSISCVAWDVGIKLQSVTKTNNKAPDYEVLARNTAGRMIKIGSAWAQESRAKKRYISMQIDVGEGPFRVNAVTSPDAKEKNIFSIIPFVGQGQVKAGSISGELIAADADNAFAGYGVECVSVRNYTIRST